MDGTMHTERSQRAGASIRPMKRSQLSRKQSLEQGNQQQSRASEEALEAAKQQQIAIAREMDEIVQKEDDFDNPMSLKDLANSYI